MLNVAIWLRAYEAAIENSDAIAGQAFNIGGGPRNTLSLLELIAVLEEELGSRIPLKWSDWRPGDQPVFVCDVSKAEQRLGWTPEIGVRDGVGGLVQWVRDNQGLFA